MESRTHAGVYYRVLSWQDIYECDCPARVECWHIRECRAQDQEERAYLEGIRAMTEVTNRGLVPVKPSTTALEVASPARLIDEASFSLMVGIAKTATKAGPAMLPDYIKTEEQAMAVMLGGWEWGFSPFTALRLVFPVNGKLNVLTEGYMALVRRRGGRFIFHEISDMAAEVELVIGGESRIRVRYSESERLRAGQGMKKVSGNGEKEWIPVYESDGKTPKKYAAGHQKAGQTIYQRNARYDKNSERLVEDPESPWTKYRADMFAWAACKRCIKFGASDFIDLAPIDIAPIEMDEIEESPLSRAMFAGEWRPADLEDDPDEEGPEHDEDEGPPAGLEDQVEFDGAPAPGMDQAAASSDPLEPAELLSQEDAVSQLTALLTGINSHPSYPAVYSGLSRFMPDGKSRFDPAGLLDQKTANEALQAVRNAVAGLSK